MATGIHMQVTQRQNRRIALVSVGQAFLPAAFQETSRWPGAFVQGSLLSTSQWAVKGEQQKPGIRLGYVGCGLRLNAHDSGPPRPRSPRAL